MIVDDDQDICEYIQTLLSSRGYYVRAITDPTQTIPLLRKGVFHVIILDLMMPQMGGTAVLQQIRKVDSDVAVVIFTGYPSVDSAVESLKLNVSDYLRKPISGEEFRAVIDKVVREKGLVATGEEELHATIGENIRRLRKEQDLTLRQLSRRTNLSTSLISQLERGESSASISSLHKVAVALNVNIVELFK